MEPVSKGAAGEILAARFLCDKGYALLASNYRCRFGEIDIIASDEEYIVFVEVKTRQAGSLYAPKEAVTQAKQRRILQTAAVYLSRHPSNLQPRFDVVEIVTDRQNSMRVLEWNHLMGAYEAGDLGGAF